MVVVFGVNLALPLLLALGLVIRGRRGEDDERRAYFALARLTIIVYVFMQLLCVGYHARLIAGTAEVGTVTHKEEFSGDRNSYCRLTLRTAQGELELDVRQGYCHGAPELGAGVPVIMVAGSTMFAQVGERVTAHAGLTFGLGPLMLLVLLWWLIRGPARREP